MTIGVVDYEAGNLRSVETALKFLKADYIVSRDPDRIRKADRLIFPGVGEAGAAMDVRNSTGLADAIRETADTGKLILGICIGCQLFLEKSEERDTRCLGLVPGQVRRFPKDMGLKVPHMGWNVVEPVQVHPLFSAIPEGASFYFVHSYYPSVADKQYELATTEYGVGFSSGICKDNVMAVQFHPEKSSEIGLKLLKNFLDMP